MKLHISHHDKENMLLVSRKSIKAYFRLTEQSNIRRTSGEDIIFFIDALSRKFDKLQTPVMRESLSCFVTLFKTSANGPQILRGCIGSLEPERGESLLKNIVHNSIMAAFYDYRFEHLYPDEISDILIEISILSPLQDITFGTLDELIQKVNGKGVVINHSTGSATFLPQVWENFKAPALFLERLANKAGIPASQLMQAAYQIYEVTKFSESD